MDKYVTKENTQDIIRFYAKLKVAQKEKARTSIISSVSPCLHTCLKVDPSNAFQNITWFCILQYYQTPGLKIISKRLFWMVARLN